MCAIGQRRLGLGSLLLMAFISAPAIAQTVTVVPETVSVPIGGSRTLTAYVNGTPSTAVVWSVNWITGGNSVVGTIDAMGNYTAPASPPPDWKVRARATSTVYLAAIGKSVITVRNAIPRLTSLSPTSLPVGPFTLEVGGSRYVQGAQVLWNGTPLPTTFISAKRLIATGVATQAGSVAISVANPGPEAVSETLLLTVTAPATATRINSATAAMTRTPTMMMPTATRTATRTEPSRSATPTATSSVMRTATIMATATMRTETSRTIAPTATRSASRTPTGVPTATSSITVSVAPGAATVQTGATQQFQATVSGSANQAVTWRVNNTAGGDASVGTITASGLYTAPAAVPPTGVVTVSALSAANGSSQGAAMVTIQDPLTVTYGRLLDQTTFGPTSALMGHVAQVGVSAFIEEQLASAESPWPALSGVQRSDAVDAFFTNALTGQDQLRQRVIYALSEIIVESMNKNTNGDEVVPWLQLLSRNAFGNYRTLLREITLDASMGKFLDLANSGFSGAPNENFPREVMQLFSIGLYKLNLDGSLQVDAQNVPIPTYSQFDVQQLAKALTGWTYGNSSGTPPGYQNSNYYPGPMLPVAAYHNKSAKTVLGQSLPANQTAQQDFDAAIDIIFQHPNVGPFLATRLIRALVTSNPSPAYIARVATAFNGGVRGDMKAVLRAILLDPEARNDTPPATFGRLRTPVQHLIALSRALSLDLGPPNQFAYLFGYMNEDMLNANSVFGHYSPSYHVPLSNLFGPEFQIYSVSDAINRANLFYLFMYSPWPINPALQPFVAVAGNAASLVAAVDTTLLYGRMLPATRAALLAAMPAMPDNNARVLTAVYLTSMSGEYLVQR